MNQILMNQTCLSTVQCTYFIQLFCKLAFHFQFVPFRDFMKEGNFCQSQAALAKEVLAEIPDQFLSYMKKHNFKPGSPPTAPPGYEELH